MTRILFISSSLNRAGTESFIMNVFRGISPALFHIDFLIFSQDKTDYTYEVELHGSQIYRMPSRREHPFVYGLCLFRFFQQHISEYHAIHWCGNSLSSMLPLFFAKIYNVPIRIVHAHNSSAHGLHNRLLHLLFRNFVSAITTHHLACSQSAAKWFFPHHNCVVVPNGIDLSSYTFNSITRNQIRQQLGISPSAMVLGHIGRFAPEKNHIFLLKMFACYHVTHPTSILMLIGKGPLMETCKSQTHQLGLQDSVLFLGERTDVNKLLQAMDCFVLPSIFEGAPFVLVEAQAASLPCIVSNAISQENAITNLIYFCNLNDSHQQWSAKIDKALTVHRTTSSQLLKDAGFDVKDTIKYLEKIYLS